MKEFDCSDVIPGCAARFRVGSEEELFDVVAVHARHSHTITGAQMPPDVLARIRAAIRAVEC